MGQLRLDTVDRIITLEHSRQDVTLRHNKWYIYNRTQGQLYQDTVDVTVTIGHSRPDNYVRTH